MRLLLLSLHLLISNVSPHHLVVPLYVRYLGGLKLSPHPEQLMVNDLLLDVSLRYPLLLRLLRQLCAVRPLRRAGAR